MSMNTQTYDFYGVPSRKNGNKFDPKKWIMFTVKEKNLETYGKLTPELSSTTDPCMLFTS